ncbi:MAG TPA: methyl-accepting chemotaxis protein [Kofleriaceae bacterium]|nr:methyl-accepting chemotaxis protein [Kofleriaceae bacterium]
MFRVEKILGSLRVNAKLTAAFALVIGLMAAASVSGLVSSRSNLTRINRMVVIDAALAREGARATGNLLELREAERDMVLEIGEAGKLKALQAKWEASFAEELNTFAALDKVATAAAEREAIAEMRKITTGYGEAIRKMIADAGRGAITTTEAAAAALDPVQDSIDQLDEAVTKWSETHEAAIADTGTAISREMSSALLFTFILTVLALASSFLIAYLLGRSIRRPLESAVAGARAVAEGRFVIDAPEELGQVQQAFDGVRDLLVETRDLKSGIERDNRELQNSITELLRVVASASEGDLTVRAPVSVGALGNVSDAFNSLLESLQELLGVVAGQIRMTETIVSTVRDASSRMATGATTQSAELADANALIQRMSAEILKVSDGAQIAVAATKRTELSAVEGSKAVEEVIAGMGTLRANVQAGAKKMKNLGDRSMEITGIVSTISRISEQTNMLALNAAIEAARAGEHSRGFAIVAEEVRKLAERTATATRDIDRLVRAIHVETTETVTAIEQQTHVVEKEAEAVGEAGQSLRKIQGASSESSAVVVDISAIAREQAQRTGNVVSAIGRITSIARETETGAAGTASTVQRLAQVAQDLQRSVSRFKVA